MHPPNGSSTKSKFQKALDAVTRKSGRPLELGSEKSFHLSISKGRKKSLIDRAHVDWDCDGEENNGMVSKLNKSHSDMFGDINASHNRVMSQLNLDVEDLLMPPPSQPGDSETQDDSGFHSAGMSSSGTGSYSPKSEKKTSLKNPKSTAKRSESQPGRINRSKSTDFKEAPSYHHGSEGVSKSHLSSDVFRTRSRILPGNHEHNYCLYGPHASPIYGVPPPSHRPVECSSGKKKSINKSYLQKLVSFPLFGNSKSHSHHPHQHQHQHQHHHPPPHPNQGYGKGYKSSEFDAESGRTFYL